MFSSQNSQVSNNVNYIEDVFSTYLYTGNGSTQTITNGIDLAGEGGLVWSKDRTGSGNHSMYDTVRGATKRVIPNLTNGESTVDGVTSFSSSGYSIASSGNINDFGSIFVSWTFRKQPKFFDVVTYTGDGAASRNIAHSLGSVPGCMIVKRTSSVENWAVYHRSLNGGTTPYNYSLRLNSTNAEALNGSDRWVQNPTSTVFTVGSQSEVNTSGQTYVAYLFAHNAGGFGLTGTDNVISCGSFNFNTFPQTVELGYEPQWLMVKRSDGVGDWIMFDNMRGFTANSGGGAGKRLLANTSGAETANDGLYYGSATGFNLNLPAYGNYIYIAIRRGPMAMPTLGTSVFSVDTSTVANDVVSTLTFPDLGLFRDRTTVTNWFASDRLRGFSAAYYTPTLYTNLTNAEATPTAGDTVTANGYNNKIYAGGAGVAGNYPLLYSFRRAPGFFDEVCYTGAGADNVYHNLTVAPEMIITKGRSNAANWAVYHKDLGNTKGLNLNTTGAVQSPVYWWYAATPQATVYQVGGNTTGPGGTNPYTSAVGVTYVAYLFATVAGVSKVGSYTGTGALQTVACGFTSGARFVLIKRTDSTGDWYVWDSARGITSGNDPYLLINNTAAEVTATNYVDTDTTGFKVTAAAPAGLNASGGTYIFLAIA